MCETSRSSDPTDLASYGEEDDYYSVSLKKYVGWWGAEHNEKECRNFSSGQEKKRDQHRVGHAFSTTDNDRHHLPCTVWDDVFCVLLKILQKSVPKNQCALRRFSLSRILRPSDSGPCAMRKSARTRL